MVVDSSALIAILKQEPEALRFASTMADASTRLLSSVSYFEAALVWIGSGPKGAGDELDALIGRAQIEIVPFDLELAREARSAFIVFGKGRHPAALNMGDCAAYALAKSRGLPLLYKGGDFARTDIAAALS